MKSISVLAASGLVLAAVAGQVAAQEERTTPLLDKGTQELSVSGRIEFPGSSEVDFDIDGSYGYFFRDGWEAGIEMLASSFGASDRVELAGFTEYNFNRNSNVVPYVGGALGLVTADFNDSVNLSTPVSDDDGLVFNIDGGVKFFVRPYMAVSLSIAFKLATSDVFATDNEIKDSLTSIRVGMRYYF